MKIIIENKAICDYFNQNKHITAEAALLLMIELIEMTAKKCDDAVTNMVQTKILEQIAENNQHLKELKTDVHVLKNELLLKFIEIKKDYVEDIKTIMQNGNSVTVDKLTKIIEQTNSVYIDKTTLLLNDIIPKTQNTYNKQIEMKILAFQKAMVEETQRLLASKPSDITLNDFLQNFESKTASLLQSGVQLPLHNMISASESRLNSDLAILKNNAINKETLFENLGEYLNKNKYKNSNAKGKFSENKLEEILNQLFPTSFIKNTSAIPESGDFILQNRDNYKPEILFENKDYSVNVNNEEIDKFIRDVKARQCHGILISQNSGVVNKPPFHIDIYDNLVVVYVSNCGYDGDKIKIAVDIIDTIATSFGTFFQDITADVTLTHEMVDEINKEYCKFTQHKLALIEHIKNHSRDFAKRLSVSIEEIQFPALTSFLSGKMTVFLANRKPETPVAGSVTAAVLGSSLLCPVCNIYNAKNLSALGAHKKSCLRKNPQQQQQTSNSDDNNDDNGENNNNN